MNVVVAWLKYRDRMGCGGGVDGVGEVDAVGEVKVRG